MVEPESGRHNHHDEDIEPITHFNFDNGAQAPKELNLTHKDDELQKELWRWHLKLNHLSFMKIRVMALQGVFVQCAHIAKQQESPGKVKMALVG